MNKNLVVTYRSSYYEDFNDGNILSLTEKVKQKKTEIIVPQILRIDAKQSDGVKPNS